MQRPRGRRELGSSETLEEVMSMAENCGMLETDEKQARARQGAPNPLKILVFL